MSAVLTSCPSLNHSNSRNQNRKSWPQADSDAVDSAVFAVADETQADHVAVAAVESDSHSCQSLCSHSSSCSGLSVAVADDAGH